MATPEAKSTGFFKTPDITPAQIIAVVGSILGIIVAAGLDISAELQAQIIRFIEIVAPILIVGDAGVRIGRSVGSARKDAGK